MGMQLPKDAIEGFERAVREGRVNGLGVQLPNLGVDPGPPDREFTSESDFQGWVIDLARSLGWKAAHFRSVLTIKRGRNGRERRVWETPVQADGAGFPDLVLARDGRLVAAELKYGKNRVTPEQRHWLVLLGTCPGVKVYEWYPRDVAEIRGALK